MRAEDSVWLGIGELQRAIESAETSATDVTEAFLARIERVDPTVGAYAEVWPERARAAAARLDAARVEGEPLAPLHGVPIALKDLCDVEGDPTRAGCPALGEEPARANAEVVDRLQAAGAILLGKTKMTEGAFVAHHPSVRPPRNPWNPARWTGISSSGSGVAVAAGLAVAALGTDTGGSIRFPSAACGVVGLKPTHGRVSLRGVFPCAESLDHIGPMARSVDDAARIFSVLCGHDPGDRWSLADHPVAGRPSALAPRISGVRIGVDPSYLRRDVDPPIVDAIERAIEVFRAGGAEIVDVSMPPVDAAVGAWLVIAATEIALAHATPFATRADQYGPELRTIIELGLSQDGRRVTEAWRTRVEFGRRFEALFDRIDAMLAPVLPTSFPADLNLADAAAHPAAAIAPRFTTPFDLSGSPSLTLSAGFDEEGAPIGFQLLGAQQDELRLLALGAAYQASTEWHEKRPSV